MVSVLANFLIGRDSSAGGDGRPVGTLTGELREEEGREASARILRRQGGNPGSADLLCKGPDSRSGSFVGRWLLSRGHNPIVA